MNGSQLKNIESLMTSSIFWVSIMDFFLQPEEDFSAAVKSLFDENSSNKFYIGLCVQIFNLLFFIV